MSNEMMMDRAETRISPSRSLGPALMSWTLAAQWIYILGPMLGAVAGACVYRWLRQASQHRIPSQTVEEKTEGKGA